MSSYLVVVSLFGVCVAINQSRNLRFRHDKQTIESVLKLQIIVPTTVAVVSVLNPPTIIHTGHKYTKLLYMYM